MKYNIKAVVCTERLYGLRAYLVWTLINCLPQVDSTGIEDSDGYEHYSLLTTMCTAQELAKGIAQLVEDLEGKVAYSIKDSEVVIIYYPSEEATDAAG